MSELARGRLTIGEVARRTGVSVKALRFYDDLGILAVAGRSAANYRLFTEDVLRCVEHIRRLQEAGLTLRQLQAIVEGRRRGEDPEALLRRAYADALERTERDLAALEARRERLRGIVAAAGRGDLTLQRAGGCTLSGETTPQDAAQYGRDTWPVPRRRSNGSAASSPAAPERAKASNGSRRSSAPSPSSSFARGR